MPTSSQPEQTAPAVVATPSTRAYATTDPASALAPFSITRRSTGPRDVRIDILYCGVCHSDLHQARNEWANTVYPCVPGHEIVGRVSEIGRDVTRFAVGQLLNVQRRAACAT